MPHDYINTAEFLVNDWRTENAPLRIRSPDILLIKTRQVQHWLPQPARPESTVVVFCIECIDCSMHCTDNEYISIMPVRPGYIEHKEWLCNDLAGPLVWSSFGWWGYYNLVQFVKMVWYSFDCQGQVIKINSGTFRVVW